MYIHIYISTERERERDFFQQFAVYDAGNYGGPCSTLDKWNLWPKIGRLSSWAASGLQVWATFNKL